MRTLLLIALALPSCVGKTTYTNKTTHPDGTVTEWGGHLGGNYGLVPTKQERGNLGDGGGGGLLGAILPGFGYKDNYSRSFVEAKQPTKIKITAEGLEIEGVVDHSTSQEIQSNGINRGVRNVATLIGWLVTMNTIESISLAKEATKRLENSNATDVQLQELFTQEELASIEADITKFQAGAESEAALEALRNEAAANAAQAEIQLLQILGEEGE